MIEFDFSELKQIYLLHDEAAGVTILHVLSCVSRGALGVDFHWSVD